MDTERHVKTYMTAWNRTTRNYGACCRLSDRKVTNARVIAKEYPIYGPHVQRKLMVVRGAWHRSLPLLDQAAVKAAIGKEAGLG